MSVFLFLRHEIVILEMFLFFLLGLSRGARNSEQMCGVSSSVVVNVGDDGQEAGRETTSTGDVALRRIGSVTSTLEKTSRKNEFQLVCFENEILSPTIFY